MRCIHLHPLDTIAIVTGDVCCGQTVSISGGTQLDAESGAQLVAKDNIPRFNKIALVPIAAGEPVLRYGLPIGLATTDIAAGQFVHIHNITSAWIPTYTREHNEHDSQSEQSGHATQREKSGQDEKFGQDEHDKDGAAHA